MVLELPRRAGVIWRSSNLGLLVERTALEWSGPKQPNGFGSALTFGHAGLPDGAFGPVVIGKNGQFRRT